MRLRWFFILILVAVLIVSTITFGESQVPRIVDVSWQPNNKAIQVILDRSIAGLWNEQWEMHIDDKKMPVTAPQGYPNVRPNAEMEKNPTGLFIGTIPWPTGLSETDFPCCGAIKFCIPDKVCTNEVSFDLVNDGCKTASQKNCGGQSPSGSNVQVMEAIINPENIGKVIAEQGSEVPPGGGYWGQSAYSETFESLGQGSEVPPGGGYWGQSAYSETFESPAGSNLWKGTMEPGLDIPGMNLKLGYDLPSEDPQLCANDCANYPNCMAFTYVKPGT